MERPETQFKIQRLSIWARDGFDRILRCFVFRELAVRARRPTHTGLDWLFADVCRGPLFVRRRMRSDFGNSLRAARRSFFSAKNPQSAVELAEGVRFELTRPFGLPVFKTGAINRSATPPEKSRARELCHCLVVDQAGTSEVDPAVPCLMLNHRGKAALLASSAERPIHLKNRT